MNNRRVYCQPEDIIEILEPTGLSALKVRILKGARGNTQVMVYSQPGCRLHVDLTQQERATALAEDLTDTDSEFFRRILPPGMLTDPFND
jgi:hypothetical protein